MTEPLNYEGPLPAAVVAAVEAYLQTPIRRTDSGWPPVTDDDLSELWQLVEMILEAKFERDCDNDMVVQFALCRRNRGFMHTVVVPNNDLDDDVDVREAMHSISYMTSIIDTLAKRTGLKASERINHTAAQEKLQPVREAASRLYDDGHIDLSKRLIAWCDSDWSYCTPSIFVGRHEGLWAPLGLTTKDINDVMGDRHDRHGGLLGLMLRKCELYLEG